MGRTFLRVVLGVIACVCVCHTGCLDPEEGSSTKGAALYVFDAADGATKRLLIWDSLDRILEQSTPPQPDRTLSGDQLDRVKNLAWGGLCVDTSGNTLFAVSTDGKVLRVSRIRNQNGTVSQANEVAVFSLGSSSDQLKDGHFEQAAVDPATGTLYVMETNDSDARVWVVSNAANRSDNSTVSPTSIAHTASLDSKGSGVAVGQSGTVYAHFMDGGALYNFANIAYNGPRLRMGQGSFPDRDNVIIGANAGLAKHGVLAFDTGNNKLYVARHLEDSGSAGAPIQVFTPSQFSQGFDASASDAFGSTTLLRNLRVLSHGGKVDWLVAAASTSDTAGSTVYIWKNAIQKGAPFTFNAGSAVRVKGLAVDGNN